MRFYITLSAILLVGPQMMGQVSIDSTKVFLIGGIKQVVKLQGRDISKPLLLFLHGGPGNSVMHYAHKFTNRLQEHFVVVQWDQREVGKTLALNKSPDPLSVAQFEADTHALIDTLLNLFDRPKLYLAGHSWGTHLGFYIAINYPELLNAYIAICPMVNQLESERIILSLMKEKAERNGNKAAARELAVVKVPFENGQQLYVHRKWLLEYMGSKGRITNSMVNEWSSTWLQVFNEASQQNLPSSVPRIDCPIYFFVGRSDFQTNSTVTKKYYEILTAPKKKLFWFDRSAHSLPTSEPEKLQEIIIAEILE